MPRARVHFRACPLCEAICGLEMEFEDGLVKRTRGDVADPFSRGHICPKGAALGDVQQDPDRVRFPLRRVSGRLRAVAWPEAIEDIADRLHRLQREHGRDCVGVYVGNPTVHHLGAQLAIFPLLSALGTRNRFSATSLDQLPQQLAAYQLFGHQGLLPVADIDRSEFFLCLGGNPLASNGSLMTAPGIRHRLAALRRRGGRFVVVDPRRTESAAAADLHLPIRPGTDAWLLAAMLNVILTEGLQDLGRLASFTHGLAALRRRLAPLTPERAAVATGLRAEEIASLARDFARASSAIAYARVGVCQQRLGGLAAYLVYALDIVTGNLDREGGMMFTTPAVDPLPLAARVGLSGSFDAYRSRVSARPEFSGELPTACLAEEIETPGEGQIRALLVHAGNPVLSAPNGARLERALGGLDLLVSFDPYVTETSRHAHYILPPAGPLECAEYDLALSLVAVRNIARFSPAALDPPAGAWQDWQALIALSARLQARRGARGRTIAAALRAFARLGPERTLDLALRLGPYGQLAAARAALGLGPELPPGVPSTGLTLQALGRAPHGLDLGPLRPRLPDRLFTPAKRIELLPDIYARELELLCDAGPPQADELLLIGRRQMRTNNSWMHNSLRLVKGRERCTLLIHPHDADRHGLIDGARAVVSSRVGEVTLPVRVSEEIRPGVLSIPHGWGHAREGVGWRTAAAHAGVSVNDITDERLTDRLTGTAAFNGVPVCVRPAGPGPRPPGAAGGHAAPGDGQPSRSCESGSGAPGEASPADR